MGKSFNYREKTLSRKFGHPGYITQIPSQLGRDLRGMKRKPDLTNMPSHVTLGTTLLIISHREASTGRHVNISECPSSEFVRNGRGRDERHTTEK